MVNYFSSTQFGSPVINGTPGSIVNAILKCLVLGWGTATPVSVNVLSSIATVDFGGSHPYMVGSYMLMNGASQLELNGVKKILSITSTKATFSAVGSLDGAATGSITTKVNPVGWLEAFPGTNITAIKPNVPEATGMILRIDDTGTTSARVVGYESMSDINSGVNAIPTAAMLAGAAGGGHCATHTAHPPVGSKSPVFRRMYCWPGTPADCT